MSTGVETPHRDDGAVARELCAFLRHCMHEQLQNGAAPPQPPRGAGEGFHIMAAEHADESGSRDGRGYWVWLKVWLEEEDEDARYLSAARGSFPRPAISGDTEGWVQVVQQSEEVLVRALADRLQLALPVLAAEVERLYGVKADGGWNDRTCLRRARDSRPLTRMTRPRRHAAAVAGRGHVALAEGRGGAQ